MTPGHTRPSWWDSAIAREALRERAVAHVHQHGGTTVRLPPEPLLRRPASRGLTHSVRVDVEPAPHTPITTAVLRIAGGAPVECEVVDGPAGSVRVLVPEA